MSVFPIIDDFSLVQAVTTSGDPKFIPKKHFKATPAQQRRAAKKRKNISARKKKRIG